MIESASLFRLGHDVDGQVVEHSHPPVFRVENTPSGITRLIAGVPGNDPLVFGRLALNLEEPICLLYVLHTPRDTARPGRYQSPGMNAAEVQAFVKRFAPLLQNDGRHDIWVYSRAESATVVWDRHNLIYAYGALDRHEASLRSLGFTTGVPETPSPHTHYYRVEYDQMTRDLIAALDWTWSELRPEDEQ